MAKTATGEVLSGEPGDVNSLDALEKIAPKPVTLTGVSQTFSQEFSAHSVTVLRLHAAR